MKKKRQIVFLVVLILLVIVGVLFFGMAKTRKPGQKKTETKETITQANQERVEEAEKNGTPKLVISSTQAAPGDTVEVTASLVNNPGILGMSFVLSYDESVLKLTKAENGEATEGVLDMNCSEELGNGCIFLWDGESIASDQIKDGEILKITFEVLDTAADGKTPVKLIGEEDGIFDNDLQNVTLTVDDGYVSVEK